MRAPIWETTPGALAALLHSKAPLLKADLYTLRLASGTEWRWSGTDAAVVANGHTWAVGPGLKRTRVRFMVGLEVDTLSLTITDVAGTTINGLPLLAFIRTGGLNGARLQLDRVFWGPDSPDPVGALLWFVGRVAEVPRIDRYEAQVSIKSDLELLDVMVPRDLYAAGCLNTLFDAQCGASRAAVTVATTATGAGDARRITFGHGLAQPAGYFDLGVATATSGANTGASRTIKQHTGTTVTVLQPWPVQVQVGDTFSLVPGCNKMHNNVNGCPKFHAPAVVKTHFRGTPYVPVPETAF